VPNNPIGQSAINHLRRYGVDTQFVARGGDRLGIYFLETGASMRASQVVYDRAGASISEVEYNMIRLIFSLIKKKLSTMFTYVHVFSNFP
jgi:sugar/nucleoside kinase (ribokinase family)